MHIKAFKYKHLNVLLLSKYFLLIFVLLISFHSFSQNKKLIAPDFEIISTNNDTFRLYNELAKHKVIILDFFSINCSTCQNNSETLKNLYQSYGGNCDSLCIWAIESEIATNEQVDTFKLNYGMTFPCFSTYNNVNDSIFNVFSISYTPIYYVIGYDSVMKSAEISEIQPIVESYLGESYNNNNYDNLGNDIKIYLSYNNIVIYSRIRMLKANITLYDITGKEIISYKSDINCGINNFNCNNKSGLYFLKITTNNISISKKLILNR